MKNILLIEDDADFSFAISRLVARAGYEVDTAASGEEARIAMAKRSYPIVVLDLGLPDCHGHDLLRAIVADDPDRAVIVLSGRDEAASAVEALRCGAFHYLTKPVTSDELLIAIAQAGERATLKRRVEALQREASAQVAEGVGRSPAWLRALDSIRSAAASPRTPVLITGESGTGKERSAHLVHAWSERAQGPFVTVNAAGFAPSLLESELFGHEAGAFTGARGQKRGVFELAHGGTLFLDEIGELPLELQPKLLRVLDGHPFRRVGGEREIRVDVRVVSATNRNLETEVRDGRFRLDFYHRLRVVEVALPALRDRGEDIGLLATHLLDQIARHLGRRTPELTSDALRALEAYAWPGNVRELKNVMERAVVLSRDGRVGLDALPKEIASAPGDARPSSGRVPVA
ncbi:MAG: sigma-54 dependent transcriptional regulator, partial [Polyangiaceae bacterium]